MIKYFANLTSVKPEMCMGEVHKGYDSYENEQPGVVSLALRLKWIITQLITVREIMEVWLFFEVVATSI